MSLTTADHILETRGAQRQLDAFVVVAVFDRAGNHHTEQLKVTERYTMTDADHINYQATITDPGTFSKPWTMSMPLYRRVERGARLGQFKCVEFVTELMYGHLRKEPIK